MAPQWNCCGDVDNRAHLRGQVHCAPLCRRSTIEREAISSVEVLERRARNEADEDDSRAYILVTTRSGETTAIGRDLNLSDQSAHHLHAVITRSPEPLERSLALGSQSPTKSISDAGDDAGSSSELLRR